MWLIFGIGAILAAVLNLAGTFTGKGAKLPCTALVHGSFRLSEKALTGFFRQGERAGKISEFCEIQVFSPAVTPHEPQSGTFS